MIRTPVAHDTCHHRTYFLACEDYEALLVRSGGRCERCGRPASENYGGKLGIDHEHRIGCRAVRGLLCQKCNAHMQRVDSGERPIDRLTAAYLALSGLILPQPVPPQPSRTYHRRPPPQPRAPMPPRSVLREFAEWYARKPGAKLPARPERQP